MGTSHFTSTVLEKLSNFSKSDLFSNIFQSLGQLSSSTVTSPRMMSPRGGAMSPQSPMSHRYMQEAVLAGTAAARTAERSLDGVGPIGSFEGNTIAPYDDYSADSTLFDRNRDIIRCLGLYSWITDGFAGPIGVDGEDGPPSTLNEGIPPTVLTPEEVMIENMWRCMSLIERAVETYDKQVVSTPSSSSNDKPNEAFPSLRSSCRHSMCGLSIIMRRFRLSTRQLDPQDLSFDNLTRIFQGSPHKRVGGLDVSDDFVRVDSGAEGSSFGVAGSAKKPMMMQDRLQHVVYCLKIDELLILYRPHAGTQYIQPFSSSGYITYAERSEAWVILQRGTSLGVKSSNLRPTLESTVGPSEGVTGPPMGYPLAGEGGVQAPLMSLVSPSSMSRDMKPYSSTSSMPIDSFGMSGEVFDITGNSSPRDRQYSRVTLPDSVPIATATIVPQSDGEYDSDDNDGFTYKPPNRDDWNGPDSGQGSTKRGVPKYRSGRSLQSMSSYGSSSSHGPSIRTSHPIPPEYLQGPPSGSNLPSYASIASSVTSARVPKAVSFTSEQSKFLFELAVESVDASCGGGLDSRKAILNNMRTNDFLKGAISFLREAEYDPVFTSPSEDSSVVTGSSYGNNNPNNTGNAKGNYRAFTDDSKRYNAFLPSGLLRLFQSKSETSPPSMPAPITLICSKTTHAIPWENLSSGQSNVLVVIRQTTLMTLFSFVRIKGGNFITGPAWQQSPLFVSTAQGINGLPVRLTQDIKAREVSRRIVGSIQSIENITHKVSHLVRTAKEMIITSSPVPSASSDEIHRKYSSICTSFQERQLPCPSALLPLGKISSQALRSRRLKKFVFYDLSSGSSGYSGGSGSGLSRQITTWIDYQLLGQCLSYSSAGGSALGLSVASPYSPLSGTVGGSAFGFHSHLPSASFIPSVFPIIILTYADLLEMSEAVTLLLLSRGDAVIVFAPHFCQGTVAKEIVRCMEIWCSPPPPSASPTVHSSQSPNSNGLSTVMSESASMASTKNLTATVSGTNSSIYEPTDVDLSNRTLPYHAIMDTVARLQGELAVPIVVFM